MDIRTDKTAGEDGLFPQSLSLPENELQGGGSGHGGYESGGAGFPISGAGPPPEPSSRQSSKPFRLKPDRPALGWQNQRLPEKPSQTAFLKKPGPPFQQPFQQPASRQIQSSQSRERQIQASRSQAGQIQRQPGSLAETERPLGRPNKQERPPGRPNKQERLPGRPNKQERPPGRPSKQTPAAAYDIIDSEELNRLYQKNDRLLASLSSSGRQNGILQSEVCSLIEQKSKLGAQNNFLENKVTGMEEKLLMFSKQQSQFTRQAFRLKQEIGSLKLSQRRGESLQARQLREQTQAAAKKLIHHIRYRQRVKKAHQGIKKLSEERRREISALEQREAAGLERIKSLESKLALSAARREAELKGLMDRHEAGSRKTGQEIKEAQRDLARLKLLLAESEASRQKEAGRAAELAKGQSRLVKERRREAAGAKRLERLAASSQKEKARILKKLEAARQALRKNSRSVYKLRAGSLKRRCAGLELEKQKLEKQKRLSLQIIQSLKARAKQDLKEKAGLKTGFEEQIKAQALRLESRAGEALGLLQKERLASKKILEENSLLRAGRDSLQKALSAQEEGFQSLMLAFRRKYIKSRQSFDGLSAAREKSRAEAEALRQRLHSACEGFQREKQSLQSEWEKKSKARANSFSMELKSAKKREESLRGEIQNLRDERDGRLRRRESAFEEEVKLLKLKIQNLEAQKREDRERHAQSLKSGYESRISSLNRSYDRKLRHIRTEMENDLCAEKRRGEAFQSMKEKQLKDMESALEAAQKEAHKLKTANFALENSQKESLNRLKKEIAARAGLAEQNKNLQDLWHALQKTSEEKDQKIHSLQSLNRSLSLALSGKAGGPAAAEEEGGGRPASEEAAPL